MSNDIRFPDYDLADVTDVTAPAQLRAPAGPPRGVAVRDSKDPDGPKLFLTPHTFRAVLDDLNP
ncbi:DUF397 domain-containing protein [Spirillospora sp. CA-142024]|uniref:DUF397 domain-containing protein n=1 Tax=Spirillospora sp. CA-142024 TaxID=3240036 RepID=UPI003D89E145